MCSPRIHHFMVTRKTLFVDRKLKGEGGKVGGKIRVTKSEIGINSQKKEKKKLTSLNNKENTLFSFSFHFSFFILVDEFTKI